MSPHIIQEAPISESVSIPVRNGNGNAFNLKVNVRDVIFLLVLVGGWVGSYFANQASNQVRIDALNATIQDMRQDFREQIRELRSVIERKP